MSRLFPFFSVLAQGTISDLVCQIFDIKHDFFGGVVSNMAKVWIVLIVKHEVMFSLCAFYYKFNIYLKIIM